MYAFDPDACNTIALEDKKERQEERKLKNSILNMTNAERKQEEWNKHFSTKTYTSNLIF